MQELLTASAGTEIARAEKCFIAPSRRPGVKVFSGVLLAINFVGSICSDPVSVSCPTRCRPAAASVRREAPKGPSQDRAHFGKPREFANWQRSSVPYLSFRGSNPEMEPESHMAISLR